MYNGKYAKSSAGKRFRGSKRTSTLILSLLLLLTFAIGGTLAYLVADTKPVENSFTPGEVTCDVTDEVDKNYKQNIQVTNTGNVDAYLRVKLVSYRTNDLNEIIGGTASVVYTPPENSLWIHYGDHYYYTLPVKPGDKPTEDLAQVLEGESAAEKGIKLSEYEMLFDGDGEKLSGDMEGGKQVIEVIAEAIQADGVDKNGNHPVTLAWGIEVDTDGNLMIK